MEDLDAVELWPENVDSIMLFMRVQTQWRYSATGPTGLDYAGVLSALRLMRVRPSPEFFDDLQTMESAALRAIKGK